MDAPDRPGYRPGGVTGKGFRPGQSGNPGGRPKGRGVTAALRRLLEQLHNGRPLEELLAERWLREALAGKPAYLQMLLERTEGKTPERHEVAVARGSWRHLEIGDDDKVEMALEFGMVDRLSPRLRELAARRAAERDGPPALPERNGEHG